MSSKTEIFIFRHGETDWNAEKRLQGHTDIPLNEKGREQAKKLREVVKRFGVELVLSSDLKRASETAAIVFEGTDTKISEHFELREARLGEPEGWLVSELIEKYGQSSWDRWTSVDDKDLDFCFPNGDSKRQHLQRVRTFIETEVANAGVNRVAISTHRGTVRRLIHNAHGAPADLVSIPNSKAYKLTLENSIWSFEGKL